MAKGWQTGQFIKKPDLVRVELSWEKNHVLWSRPRIAKKVWKKLIDIRRIYAERSIREKRARQLEIEQLSIRNIFLKLFPFEIDDELLGNLTDFSITAFNSACSVVSRWWKMWHFFPRVPHFDVGGKGDKKDDSGSISCSPTLPSNQGDRMSSWKSRPKCNPAHSLSRLMYTKLYKRTSVIFK
jgi:hypothetical protein